MLVKLLAFSVILHINDDKVAGFPVFGCAQPTVFKTIFIFTLHIVFHIGADQNVLSNSFEDDPFVQIT